MSGHTIGLRERKRLATRRAIQLAVLDLTAEKGFERVTVDEVSERADISPRTFFNYFPSKEEAALGDPPALPGQADVAAFVTAGAKSNLLDDLAHLLVRALATTVDDVDLLQRRRNILKGHPQLFAMRMATMRTFEDELTIVLERRLAQDDPELAADPTALSNRARLITLVGFGAMRHAWACWADTDGKSSLSDRLLDSFAQLDQVLRAAAPR